MTKTLLAFGLICATLMSGHAAAQKAGLAGKWATDAVYTARPNSSGGGGFGGGGGGSSPDGVALIMELRLVKTEITGNVVEFVSGASTVLESAAIDGMKFEFVVYKKVSNVKVGMSYKGELVDENTIAIQRFNPSGKRVDSKADGTPETLIFHRLRESVLPPRPELPSSPGFPSRPLQPAPKPEFQLL